jgi:glutaredoxin-related protein
LICEPIMYKWYLKRLNVKCSRVDIKVVSANLVSFIFCLGIYYIIAKARGWYGGF